MGNHPVFLITGAGGQLGRALAAALPNARALTRQELDVTQPGQVATEISGVDVLFHLAAMTDVDRCEAEPEEAWRVNAEGSRHVTDCMRGRGRVIFISTDYVFDGNKEGEYHEDDPTNPLNQYGHSKLAAERFVLEEPSNLVVRTSWVIGEGTNFVRTILGAARSKDRLQVVDDQRGRPTFTEPLAQALVQLSASRTAGTVHVSGSGPPTTWFDVAGAALKAAGISTPIDPIDSATYRQASGRLIARRPANSLFSLQRAQGLGVELVDWRRSLTDYVRTVT